MYFSGESFLVAFIILFAGLIVGWLSDVVVQRTRSGFDCVIAIVIVGAVIGAGLTLALHDAIRTAINLPSSKPPKSVVALVPASEPVILPLAPLRPLLKPVVYRSREEICDTLIEAARLNGLPAPFFIRLLYQESSFRPHAISSAGAQGIAQFMPETASDRGLDNPFDPVQAIPASARLLRDLSQKFGNLGLAAAAYNAGPKRIEDWLANKGQLPQETQAYVKTITSWPAEAWTGAQTGSPAVKLQRYAPCQETVGLLAWDGPDEIPLPPRKPRAQEPSDHPKTAQRSNAVHAISQTTKRGQDNKTDARPDKKLDVRTNAEPAVIIGNR
jgi:uncharacterized membrane protein YeaQ/YmgE (transglycosylase-associated protein family)